VAASLPGRGRRSGSGGVASLTGRGRMSTVGGNFLGYYLLIFLFLSGGMGGNLLFGGRGKFFGLLSCETMFILYLEMR
jgi:hypothetical protein